MKENPGNGAFGANAGVNCGRAEGPYFFGAGNCFNCAVDKVKIFSLELFMSVFDSIALRS